jgi:enoyl-CoA hydratase/carnithine racemase
MPPEPSSDVVLVERHGAVSVLTLNRPEARNALNAALAGALRDRLREAEDDAEVHAVVLAGAGPAFCAGADLRELPAGTPEEAERRVELAMELHGTIPAMRTPVVAAVGGPAVAGGCGLAMACDLVVAAEDAWFGYPEVRRGLVAALVMVSLERLVGRRTALDLLLTGRRVAPAEARALGMVTEVVAPGQELARALERAQEIAAFPPGAVGMTKELLGRVGDLPYAAALRQAAQVNRLMRATAEARAGSEAFIAGNGGRA